MSSILKALKKLEQEKVQRSGGSVDIARDILRTSSRRKRPAAWPVLLVVTAGIGLAALAGYFFLGPREKAFPPGKTLVNRSPAPNVLEEANESPPNPSPLPTPGPNEPEVVERTMESRVPAEVVETPRRNENIPQGSRAVTNARKAAPEPKTVKGGETKLSWPKPAPSPEPATVAAKAGSSDSPGPSVLPAPGRPAASNSHPSAPALPLASQTPVTEISSHDSNAPAESTSEIKMPVLVVSGIAYQDDRSARLAIVNDLPVMEGTIIEGAKVEEILFDRVRFSFKGHPFEVDLVK